MCALPYWLNRLACPETHCQARLDRQLFGLPIAVTAQPGRLPREVVVDVDRRQCNDFRDTRRPGPRHDIGESGSQCPGVHKKCVRTGQCRGRRRHHRDAVGQVCRLWVTAHCAHLDSGARQFFDQGTADVTGGPRDNNGHVALDFLG
jgi:hypothetical protein